MNKTLRQSGFDSVGETRSISCVSAGIHNASDVPYRLNEPPVKIKKNIA